MKNVIITAVTVVAFLKVLNFGESWINCKTAELKARERVAKDTVES